jgi:PilZ domain-containing protein
MPFALAFGDGLICGPDLMRVLETTRTPIPERRKRPRANLSWTVQLFRPGDPQPILGQTRNISSEGLYCVIAQPFVVGEVVAYMLLVPTFDAGHQENLIRLAGRLKVLRLEPLTGGLYGLAGQVRDYNVVRSQANA